MAENFPILPVEIQQNILSFISPYEMNDLKLVSKGFYAMCCKLQSFKSPLIISQEVLNNQDVIDSISSTLIRFDELQIHMDIFLIEEHRKIMDILKIHGSCIKTLILLFNTSAQIRCKQSYIVTWLNTMPNLEKLKSNQIKYFEYNDLIEELDDEVTPLNLPEIRIVCNPPLSVAHKLHTTPNASITSLTFGHIDLTNIALILNRHASTLKELTFNENFPFNDAAIFRQLQGQLKLRLLNIYSDYQLFPGESLVIEIIENQKELEEVRFCVIGESNRYFAPPRLLPSICRLKKLKRLEICLDVETSLDDIQQFAKLQQLEELWIEFDSENLYQALSRIPISSLKLITLKNESDIEVISKSFPNLEDLSLFAGPGGSYNDILDALHKLKTLSIERSSYIFHASEKSYPNMERLELYDMHDSLRISREFLQAMPNLKYIVGMTLTGDLQILETLLESRIEEIDIQMPYKDFDNSEQEQFNILKEKLQMKCTKGCKIEFVHYEGPDNDMMELELI